MITIRSSDGPPGSDTPVPDTYFGSSYGTACAAASNSKWIRVEAYDGSWQIPLLIRPTLGGALDAASPPGYSGVYANEELNDDEQKIAWKSTIDALRDMGVISVFLRHSPLVTQATPLPSQKITIQRHPTVLVDVTTPDEMWAQMEGRCRTAIRKASRVGISTAVRPATTLDVGPRSWFRILYDEAMHRKGATSTHLLPDRYYELLSEGLGSELLVAEAVDEGNRVLTSMLLMRHTTTFHYHLSASNEEGARSGSNSLLLWNAFQYASLVGARRFHLGGGLKADDSLFKFKKSFGGRIVYYSASGLVIDPDRYHSETAAAAELSRKPQGEFGSSTFFPIYRSPTHDPLRAN